MRLKIGIVNPISSAHHTRGVHATEAHRHDVDNSRHIRPYHNPGLLGRQQGRSECGERVAVERRGRRDLIGDNP
jgi:hypothetical protein